MQSEESNTLVKLAKAVIERAPEGGDAFWGIKFSDIEAALSAAEPPIRLPTALSLMIEKDVDPEQNGYCKVIDVEKFLCAKLGKEWSATGMSIVSLVDEISALSAQAQDVVGWQLAPKEPTPEMVVAAKSTTSAALTKSHATEIYRAMLAAAPAKQEGGTNE